MQTDSKSIDPVVFFKLMLIGYLENLNSDRRIINMTKLRLDMLYFIGYNIDEALPWHSTAAVLSLQLRTITYISKNDE